MHGTKKLIARGVALRMPSSRRAAPCRTAYARIYVHTSIRMYAVTLDVTYSHAHTHRRRQVGVSTERERARADRASHVVCTARRGDRRCNRNRRARESTVKDYELSQLSFPFVVPRRWGRGCRVRETSGDASVADLVHALSGRPPAIARMRGVRG